MPRAKRPSETMSRDEYERRLAMQGGVCAISGRAPKTRRLAIDHDHKTDAVRGLLSPRINQGLQMFNDNPVWLRRAADYLEGIL